MKEKMANDVSGNRCPFITDPPKEDCYCARLTSRSAEKAIYYCGNNFHECEIYKSLPVRIGTCNGYKPARKAGAAAVGDLI